MNLLVVWAVIFSCSLAYRFMFIRDIECVSVGKSGCQKWKESSIFMMRTSSFFCYSGSTYVQTKNGPRQMAHLKLDDEILGLNSESGKVEFSPMTAWLHHDSLAESNFIRLTTENGMSYESSSLHNLGFVHEGRIDYKFANEFLKGEKLISYPALSMQVTEITKDVVRKGLFSPYTTLKNYFVYPFDFNPQSTDKQEMILAHVLSQVKQPQKKEVLMSSLVWSCGILGQNYQPDSEQEYTHPIMTHFTFLFGSHWKEEENIATYRLSDVTETGPMESHQRKYSNRRRRKIEMMGKIGVVAPILDIVLL